MINNRLNGASITNLIKFSEEHFDGMELAVSTACDLCDDTDPVKMCTRAYGVYKNQGNAKKLASILIAVFEQVFPNAHTSSGKVCYVSCVYTAPEFRRMGLATRLLDAVEYDAFNYFKADTLVGEANASTLYLKNGFKLDENNNRYYKQIRKTR